MVEPDFELRVCAVLPVLWLSPRSDARASELHPVVAGRTAAQLRRHRAPRVLAVSVDEFHRPSLPVLSLVRLLCSSIRDHSRSDRASDDRLLAVRYRTLELRVVLLSGTGNPLLLARQRPGVLAVARQTHGLPRLRGDPHPGRIAELLDTLQLLVHHDCSSVLRPLQRVGGSR